MSLQESSSSLTDLEENIIYIYVNRGKKRRKIKITVKKWDHFSPRVGNLLTSTCKRLALSNINFPILLEEFVCKILKITDSEMGGILHKIMPSSGDFFTEARKEELEWLSLSELIPGSIILSTLKNKEFVNPFKKAYKTGCPVISSNPNVPKNHPPVNQSLVIPIFKHNMSVSALLVITREKGRYNTEHYLRICPLLGVLSTIIENTLFYKEPLVNQIEKLNEVQKVKDQFLANVSHELRTPLNGIVGMITLLPDAGPLNKKQSQYLTNLTDCTCQLTNIVNNILDYSKMTANRLNLTNNPFNITKCVKEAVRMIKGKAIVKGLKIKTNVPENIPLLLGDKQRILQVLSNLLNNAVKFTEKGYIKISVKAKPLIVLDNKEMGKKWRITFKVIDTGIGISLDDQDRIFDAFNQAHQIPVYMKKVGTGLGLSISKELCKMMGGNISVKSDGIGLGSRFTFHIILSEDLDIQRIQEENVELFTGSKILIVDDRPEIRLQLTEILFQWGCSPTAVSSAQEALQYMSHVEFNVALIDICMPDMSGIELAQEMKIIYPKIPLIGISSADINNGSKFFDYYMFKPVEKSTLFYPLMDCLNKYEKMKISDQSSTQIIPKVIQKEDIKILIVEDDEYNTFILKEMLINLGYKEENLSFSENGKEAVDKVKTIEVNVILMDIVMPIMNGIEATELIKSSMTDPPIIIAVSAAVQGSDKAKCYTAGFDGYLPKPIIRKDLEKILSTLH